MKKEGLWLAFGVLILFALFLLSLNIGEIHLSLKETLNLIFGGKTENVSNAFIVEARLNRSIMAVIGGSALAVSGLILQVFFRNPLAGPGVLGISSGVSLGVAIVILGGLTFADLSSSIGIVTAGLLGALLILSILMLVSKYIYHSVTLLIVGLMLSYFTSAFVNTLYHWANSDQTRQFVVWGLGSFEGVQSKVIGVILPIILLTYGALFALVKPLNALVLGEQYAKSLGINIKSTKIWIIIITSILTSIITVYCGPVAFVGIAVPQIVRQLVPHNSHLITIPLTLLIGAIFALFADILIRFSGNILPLNTVTSLIGAPIIVWTIIKMNRSK
ncbi:MAG: FecCD family ABC transporter permease [Putridiphycobacter sp.]